MRDVATYLGGALALESRAAANASGAESNRYEEVLVNPALLLARQRGDIDCGGLEYLVVRYGAFYQPVVPVPGGHVSVAVEPGGRPARAHRRRARGDNRRVGVSAGPAPSGAPRANARP